MALGSLDILDTVVLIAVIVMSIAIGIVFAVRDRKKETSTNYFLGNGKLKLLPTTASFVATFQASAILIGLPTEAYLFGMGSVLMGLGMTFAFVLYARFLMPVVQKLKVTSINEYFALRYGSNKIRCLVAAVNLIKITLLLGVFVAGASLASEYITGINIVLCTFILSMTSSIYSSVGGLKAVVWVDMFHFLIMVCGIVTIIIKGTLDAGGIAQVFQVSSERFHIFDFNPDPTVKLSFWTATVGGVAVGMSVMFQQSSFQRIAGIKDIKSARAMIYLASPMYFLLVALAIFQGPVAYAYYSSKGCDPIRSKAINNINKLIPLFFADLFRGVPGMTGLLMASLISYTLSTLSSRLAAMAAVTQEDLIKLVFPGMAERRLLLITKLNTLIFGLLMAGFANIILNIQIPLNQILLSVTSSVSGPVVGMFLTSLLSKRVTQKGLLAGGCVSFALVAWIAMGQTFNRPLERMLPLGPINKCPPGISTVDKTWLNTSILYTTCNITDSGTPPCMRNETIVQSRPKISSHLGRHGGLSILYSISYQYFGLIGIIVCVVVTMLVSCVTGHSQSHNVDKSLMVQLPNWAKFRQRKPRAVQNVTETLVEQTDAV